MNRWKPRLDGPIYCSPACGFKCTKAAHDKAIADGKALAIAVEQEFPRARRRAKSRVWENWGWNYCAYSPCGRIHVYPTAFGGKIIGYTAFLGEPFGVGGRWAQHGRTVRSSIRNVIAAAKAELKTVGAHLEGL